MHETKMSNQTFANPLIPLYISSQGTNVVQFNDNIVPPVGYDGKELLYCMSDHKLYFNGREISPELVTSLTFTPVASNPGTANTLWKSSVDGFLYIGATALTGGGGGDVSSSITSKIDEVATYTDTTGKVIGNSNLLLKNDIATSSIFLTKEPYSSTGNNVLVIKSNDPVSSNLTGSNNTFIGNNTGKQITSGSRNTVIGYNSLNLSSNVSSNTCLGYNCASMSTGGSNIAIGDTAGTNVINNNIAIGDNSGSLGPCINTTVIGHSSGYVVTSITNSTGLGTNAYRDATAVSTCVALGDSAGRNLVNGSSCILIGNNAGYVVGGNLTRVISIGYQSGTSATTNTDCIYIGSVGVAAESLTTRIGIPSYTKAFIHGIRGRTTGVADAIPVLIDSSGQLGTVSSSIKYKENVRDLGDTSFIHQLQPRLFNYKSQPDVTSVGLIAEEVEQVYPEMCIYDFDEEGNKSLLTVDYMRLPVLLLNEVKKMKSNLNGVISNVGGLNGSFLTINDTTTEIINNYNTLNETLASMSSTMDKLEARIKALELQKI